MAVWYFILVIVTGWLVGCARFQSRPLKPAETAERIENRSLTNEALKPFLEENLHRSFDAWPAGSWDFEMLTMAAFYYQPSLSVARAQWAVARGGEKTAGQRPNPTLNVTPGYSANVPTPSPWLPLATLDWPIETAGKRRYRRAQAARLSEAARLNIASTAWQIRSAVRMALLDFVGANAREKILQKQLEEQEEILKLLEGQVQAGARSASETFSFRTAAVQARVALSDAQRARAESQARLAEAIGVSMASLAQAPLAPELFTRDVDLKRLNTAEVRRRALQSRADILAGLAQYEAAQSALQLEIARQYPDLRLLPGYEYDQGNNKWSLGLTVDLPILNQNQGPILEAEARRAEAAAKFNALQTKVLAEIERAQQTLQMTSRTLLDLRALAAQQQKWRDAVAAQVQAGAAERLDLLSAELELTTAQLGQLDGQVKEQQALGALEDAVQRPFEMPAAIFESTQNDHVF
jgi:cobalt-zinc-cadmium efflux system outer membrane protein